MPAAEQFGVLAELQAEGKIRHVGLSEVSVAQPTDAQEHRCIASVQNRDNLLDRASADELERTLQGLGYGWTPDRIPDTIEYYRARTSHGSTLSALVHSWLHARSDRRRSWDRFEPTLPDEVAELTFPLHY
ncbi:MAG: haloacid dehalogenase, partial [Nitriliruptor sp.]